MPWIAGSVMRELRLLLSILSAAFFLGCGASNYGTTERGTQPIGIGGEVQIIKSWQGDYPVAKLDLLPVKQRGQGIGYIDSAKTFAQVWKAFKLGEGVPKIDFKTNIILFARNTQFYNHISIGRVNLKNGVAELLAMETMSALPIEDKVAMSMVLVARQGITAIQSGDVIIQIPN